MKKDKLSVYYDEEADLLEVIICRPTKSYYNGLGNDIFQRIDLKTKKVRGYTIFNFKKKIQKEEIVKEFARALEA